MEAVVSISLIASKSFILARELISWRAYFVSEVWRTYFPVVGLFSVFCGVGYTNFPGQESVQVKLDRFLLIDLFQLFSNESFDLLQDRRQLLQFKNIY